jgi:hypothetical protein
MLSEFNRFRTDLQYTFPDFTHTQHLRNITYNSNMLLVLPKPELQDTNNKT